MSKDFSIFNWDLIQKINDLVKERVYNTEVQKKIHIIENKRFINTGVAVSHQEELTLLQDVNNLLQTSVLSDNDEKLNTQPIQTTHILSDKAKNFLKEIDNIMSKDYNDIVKMNSEKPQENAPILKKTFDYMEKTYNKK